MLSKTLYNFDNIRKTKDLLVSYDDKLHYLENIN